MIDHVDERVGRGGSPGNVPTIGILSLLAGGYYYGDLIAGAAAAARRRGVRVIVAQTSLPWPEASGRLFPAPYLPLALDHIDGFLVIVDALDAGDLQRLATSGKPLVTLSMRLTDPETLAVLPDNQGGAAAAVRHLLEHGHQRIGFAGCLWQPDIRQRYEGYRTALAEQGIVADPALSFAGSDNVEGGGRESAAALLAAGRPCTAVFVATDRNALAFMEAVQAAGVRVPEDLAVVGFDDIELAQQAIPALTSVRQRFDALGEAAAEHLIAAIAGLLAAAGPVLVPTVLMCRHSCGCTGVRLPSPGPVGSYSGSDWAAVLAADLARQLVAPLLPDPDTPFDQLWPGVGLIVAALDAALQGSAAPSPTELDRAWREASLRTQSAEALDASLTLLEHAGLERQGRRGPADAGIGTGLRAFLDRARLHAVRSSMTDTLGLYRAQQAVSSISRSFLRRAALSPTDLSWMELASARRACLALWGSETAGEVRLLHVTSSYSAARGAGPDNGAPLAAQAFPPRDFLDACAMDAGAPVILLIPLGTPTQDWGVLAVAGSAGRPFHEAHDAVRQGATELTLALEHEALLRAGERQQERLRLSEERFRALVEGAPLGICLLDEADRFEDVNDAFSALLGYSQGELRGKSLTLALAEERRESAVSAFQVQFGAGANQMREVVLRRKDGAGVIALGTGISLQGRDDRPLRAIFVIDITERKQLERELLRVAQHDALTGLPNRILFNDVLSRALIEAGPKRPAALLLLDLDRFKEVNDTLGHQSGDELLCAVATRLREVIRPGDTVARLGGDEFAILLAGTREAGAVRVAGRLRAAITASFQVAGQALAIDISIGVALAPRHTAEATTLLRFADIAMYAAKEGGGGCAVYRAEQDRYSPTRLNLAADLRQAIDDGQMRLHYLPIVDCLTGRVHRLESLVRWQHPVHGLLPPALFVPLAGALGLITPLTLWVLEEALSQCRQWRDDGLSVGVAVNVEMDSVRDAQFVDLVTALLRHWGLTAAHLTLEIPETALMVRPEEAAAAVAALGSVGVRVSIDDFGTGHSSPITLQQLAVREVKIDRRFTEHVNDPRNSILIAFLIDLARALGLAVVAEGVETRDMWDRLLGLGCNEIQGFLVSAPMPPAKVADWLRARRPPPGTGAAADLLQA